MVPQWVIENKRDGMALSKEQIDFFIDGYTRGEIPDYQMAAMAMAIYLKGMTFQEIAHLTDAMLYSGDMVDTSSIVTYKVDKHSTGGIGDKVSLILAPLVACCDLAVPMISGRGLGITGGTLDKLESIPGFTVGLSEDDFIKVIHQCGFSMIGQTGEIAPADKKLYALRDVTGTVPSIPLITASIMCKKLAEGIDGLVLDVKVGTGAFMKTIEDARELAKNMVQVGKCMDKDMSALITDMNETLGKTAGNALEVKESVECLQGNGPEDLMDVTMSLCSEMLVLGGKAGGRDEAWGILQGHIDSGSAFEKFKEMTALQGGDVSVLDDTSKLAQASTKQTIKAEQAGYLSEVVAEDIGKAVLLLGGGRQKTDDKVDFAVGISDLVKVGDEVSKGDQLAVIHANGPEQLAQAQKILANAFKFSEEKVTRNNPVLETISGKKELK